MPKKRKGHALKDITNELEHKKPKPNEALQLLLQLHPDLNSQKIYFFPCMNVHEEGILLYDQKDNFYYVNDILIERLNCVYSSLLYYRTYRAGETVIRKIRAWRQLLNASGSEDTAADLETLDLFTETDLNLQPELDSDSDIKIFWKCFEDAMSPNIKR
ncbi:16793_t:CDS:2 [Entrophospora sp. SA101]|nr:16793_t:CDS:2 [Entrophospora sp. SA101]